MGELIGGFSGMKTAPLESAELRGAKKDGGAGEAAAGEVKLWYSVCLWRLNIHLIGF